MRMNKKIVIPVVIIALIIAVFGIIKLVKDSPYREAVNLIENKKYNDSVARYSGFNEEHKQRFSKYVINVLIDDLNNKEYSEFGQIYDAFEEYLNSDIKKTLFDYIDSKVLKLIEEKKHDDINTFIKELTKYKFMKYNISRYTEYTKTYYESNTYYEIGKSLYDESKGKEKTIILCDQILTNLEKVNKIYLKYLEVVEIKEEVYAEKSEILKKLDKEEKERKAIEKKERQAREKKEREARQAREKKEREEREAREAQEAQEKKEREERIKNKPYVGQWQSIEIDPVSGDAQNYTAMNIYFYDNLNFFTITNYETGDVFNFFYEERLYPNGVQIIINNAYPFEYIVYVLEEDFMKLKIQYSIVECSYVKFKRVE